MPSQEMIDKLKELLATPDAFRTWLATLEEGHTFIGDEPDK